ncbi:DUF3267 domain-containing protein [Clostridium botulinum]|uniref:DUF3267 domain-containing protein n=1 Tax=Clostridium botulinum TaxID=1491 RepID=A0A6B4G171_CLOBO|nr:DUF3267 domain-containing protein [Clostridium botulinum]MBN3382920.1 hypothetical protein [Clostridium botulinum]NFF90088.1 DUF3267 domain-containing protein [Clostridium botulinum]NFG16874.1 DUF3267 domain-containing protein [Clostridium botulinum]NFG30639.1 DUF3267 domain-containing protein [Clostridium botulinum]NFG33782.1 DUF3267 domain-containing protein [Clostridium botulinum]
MEFKITNKLHLKLLFIALIFSIIFHNYLNTIIFNFFKKSMDIFNYSITISFILLMATITMITIAHELIHGLTFTIFGGKVKYKFKFIYAATEEVSNKPISLTQFTIILLAPITVISLFSLLLPNWIGSLIFVSNLIGSIGDLYMSIGLIKYPYDSKIIDKPYGYYVKL